jgi:hypothetical protein
MKTFTNASDLISIFCGQLGLHAFGEYIGWGTQRFIRASVVVEDSIQYTVYPPGVQNEPQ